MIKKFRLYQILFMVILAGFGLLILNCTNDSPVATLAVLTTSDFTNITNTKVQSGGTVTNDGGGTITIRGVCWNTTTTPKITDNKTVDGSGSGSFTSSITGLKSGITYYVRAYATNSAGTSYGNEKSFSTTIKDFEGNIYHAVTIGSQVWMQENLKTKYFKNGNQATNITSFSSWVSQTNEAYCDYNNDSANLNPYGRLYNWYAASDSKGICPDGWHVPTSSEWYTLLSFLGDSSLAGGKLKETGTIHWKAPNTGATNESGFTGVPAGARYDDLDFAYMGDGAGLWSSTKSGSTKAVKIGFNYLYPNTARDVRSKTEGYSIRCLRD